MNFQIVILIRHGIFSLVRPDFGTSVLVRKNANIVALIKMNYIN